MYEAQQAPLYYWLSAQVPKLFLDWALADRVLLLRFLTLMVASLVVPLTYLVGYAAGGIRPCGFGNALEGISADFASGAFDVLSCRGYFCAG